MRMTAGDFYFMNYDAELYARSLKIRMKFHDFYQEVKEKHSSPELPCWYMEYVLLGLDGMIDVFKANQMRQLASSSSNSS